MNVVTQKDFLKGVDAATGKLTEAKGTIKRLYNMLYTVRGNLKTVDGVSIQTEPAVVLGSTPPLLVGLILDLNYGGELMTAFLSGGVIGADPNLISYNVFPIFRKPPDAAEPVAGSAIMVADSLLNPQSINYAGYTIFCLGNTVPWVAWNGRSPLGFTLYSTPTAQALYGSPAAPGGAATIAPVAGQSPPTSAVHGVNHLGFLWLWNTAGGPFDGPSTLRMSSAGVINDWPTTQIVQIDADDGSKGQGIASFTLAESGIAPTASLAVFKDYATYQVFGALGTPNSSVIRAQTEMGCVAPRTIQFVPGFGIIRMTHLGVALFDGVRDVLISEEIRPYIFDSEDDIDAIQWSEINLSVACVTSNPPMYVIGVPVTGRPAGLNRILCYDLVLKAWTIVDIPFRFTTIGQSKIPGRTAAVYIGGNFDETDITGPVLYRWLVGDRDWNGVPIKWKFRTPEVTSGSPTQRTYFRRAIVRALAGGNSAEAQFNLTKAHYYDGPEGITDAVFSYLARNSRYGKARYSFGRYRTATEDLVLPIDIHKTAFSGNLEFSGVGRVQIEAIDWHLENKPAGAFARIS